MNIRICEVCEVEAPAAKHPCRFETACTCWYGRPCDPNPEIRLWTQADLDRAVAGDAWLGTLLLNKGTYSEAEMRAFYRLPARRAYRINWTAEAYGEDEDIAEDAGEFAAVDDASALRFAKAKWLFAAIESIEEVTRTVSYRTIDLHPERGPFS